MVTSFIKYSKEAIEAKMVITFCKTREYIYIYKKKEVLYTFPDPGPNPYLNFNHLANEPPKTAFMLYGLMYLTYGSAKDDLIRCATDYS